jgi:hypothetical protein
MVSAFNQELRGLPEFLNLHWISETRLRSTTRLVDCLEMPEFAWSSERRCRLVRLLTSAGS